MINVLSMDKQVILATTTLMPSFMAVMNLATFPRTASTGFLHQECHMTKSQLAQGINTPTIRGTYHTPIMALDTGDISAEHSPTLIPTVTEAAVLEGTPHVLLPATAATHATPQPMDGPITPHAVIPSGIVALHPTLTTSPVGATLANPWTRASLTPAAPTTQHKDFSPGKSSNVQDPQPPINPTAPKMAPSRIPLQTPYQILTVTLIL